MKSIFHLIGYLLNILISQKFVCDHLAPNLLPENIQMLIL